MDSKISPTRSYKLHTKKNEQKNLHLWLQAREEVIDEALRHFWVQVCQVGAQQ